MLKHNIAAFWAKRDLNRIRKYVGAAHHFGACVFGKPNILFSHSLKPALLNDTHDVGFLHDEQILTINLDFRAGEFAEQNTVTLRDVEGMNSAVVIATAWARGNNFTFGGLFLSRIRNDDSA